MPSYFKFPVTVLQRPKPEGSPPAGAIEMRRNRAWINASPSTFCSPQDVLSFFQNDFPRWLRNSRPELVLDCFDASGHGMGPILLSAFTGSLPAALLRSIRLKQLLVLKLQKNNIGDLGASQLATWVQQTPDLNLESIYLSHNQIEDAGAIKLLSAFAGVVRSRAAGAQSIDADRCLRVRLECNWINPDVSLGLLANQCLLEDGHRLQIRLFDPVNKSYSVEVVGVRKLLPFQIELVKFGVQSATRGSHFFEPAPDLMLAEPKWVRPRPADDAATAQPAPVRNRGSHDDSESQCTTGKDEDIDGAEAQASTTTLAASYDGEDPEEEVEAGAEEESEDWEEKYEVEDWSGWSGYGHAYWMSGTRGADSLWASWSAWQEEPSHASSASLSWWQPAEREQRDCRVWQASEDWGTANFCAGALLQHQRSWAAGAPAPERSAAAAAAGRLAVRVDNVNASAPSPSCSSSAGAPPTVDATLSASIFNLLNRGTLELPPPPSHPAAAAERAAPSLETAVLKVPLWRLGDRESLGGRLLEDDPLALEKVRERALAQLFAAGFEEWDVIGSTFDEASKVGPCGLYSALLVEIRVAPPEGGASGVVNEEAASTAPAAVLSSIEGDVVAGKRPSGRTRRLRKVAHAAAVVDAGELVASASAQPLTPPSRLRPLLPPPPVTPPPLPPPQSPPPPPVGVALEPLPPLPPSLVSEAAVANSDGCGGNDEAAVANSDGCGGNDEAAVASSDCCGRDAEAPSALGGQGQDSAEALEKLPAAAEAVDSVDEPREVVRLKIGTKATLFMLLCIVLLSVLVPWVSTAILASTPRRCLSRSASGSADVVTGTNADACSFLASDGG